MGFFFSGFYKSTISLINCRKLRHLEVFDAADNLKAIRATHSFLGLNENFTKLKIGDKSLFRHVFEKVFSHQFYF